MFQENSSCAKGLPEAIARNLATDREGNDSLLRGEI